MVASSTRHRSAKNFGKGAVDTAPLLYLTPGRGVGTEKQALAPLRVHEKGATNSTGNVFHDDTC